MSAAAEQTIAPLQSEFLVQFDIEATPPHELGITPRGRRRVVYVSGGRFHGPKLNGKLLPGGGDAALVRSDGVFEADVRFLLQCDDGAMIHVTYRGLWHAAPGVLDRLLKREGTVTAQDYYFRTAVFFETAHPDYLWLNGILAVGVGMPRMGTQGGTTYQVHRIL